MTHYHSVFTNSCLRVPVDPVSKMPKTEYERTGSLTEQCSIDSMSSCSLAAADLDAIKLKEFYRNIPDYKDINHLPTEEFYLTLKSLREKKKIMLDLAMEHIDDCTSNRVRNNNVLNRKCCSKSKYDDITGRKYCNRNENIKFVNPSPKQSKKSVIQNNENIQRSCKKATIMNDASKTTFRDDLRNSQADHNKEQPKRNYSACSISWNVADLEKKDEIDEKFEQYFDKKKYNVAKVDIDDPNEFKAQSMPSSPLRSKRVTSPLRKRKSITVPKPFKMTERDDEERIVNELRSLRKSFSEDMLNQKCEKKKFKAKPVPIESRIPLYDKILEDQAMRRAITKINSEAELRAQMKPFSFTKREEKGITGICEKAALIMPKRKKKKRFRAKPIPKNLFSNYFYNNMKEDEYFRSMNKRIRAEEMLRTSQYPGNMATRDRSRLSTPAAHSDLPIDPSPGIPSTVSSDRQRCVSPSKNRTVKGKKIKEDFVTTSPQPFRLCTADRAAKKMENITMKMYQESKSSESTKDTALGPAARAYSALELRGNASGRSNLAALLRAEAVRRKFEMDAANRLAEHRRRMETRQRDRQLRSKPAWHLVKNNHEEDIAMRLQTRRDEERMRREEFLHEMELMYGRVQQQPMLFERYYAPRSQSLQLDTLQLSPRKTKKRSKKSFQLKSPCRSRKVSINDTAETYSGDVTDFLNRIDVDDKYAFSDIVDSLDRVKL
ncbi:protein FAM161A [Bombyx mori]|uniref:Protein FAM161A n=1 Tax=Bombyx mori TaxID=7091 RepID=A0A8R2M888_BOMMO|nr:protein FAM161A [Bombyx mori]